MMVKRRLDVYKRQALVMELAPWPAGFQAFKPSWLILVLLYWTLALPDRVSIGWAFLLGVLWDIVLGLSLIHIFRE